MQPIKPTVPLFGIVKSFDKSKGFGSIQPEDGGEPLRFENSAIKWTRSGHPTAKMRLTYELGTNPAGEPCAVNLNVIERSFL
jgi:cold shock CspA family protein